MNKQIIVLLLLILSWAGLAQAAENRALFGDVDGYLLLTHENDLTDNDLTVVKSELSLWKDFQINTVKIEPYYLFKNDNFQSPVQPGQRTENTAGVDLIVQSSSLQKVSVGIGLKNLNDLGDSDNFLITRLRLDF
jgi:hypothetical protein